MQILPPSTGKAYEPYIADLKSWFTAPADETFLYFKFEGLPRGLSYNEFTGDLSGFPYDKGEFYIIITAYTSKRIPLSSPPKFETLTRKASTFFNVGPGKPSIKPNQNFSAALGYNALLAVEFDDINDLPVANLQVTSGALPAGCFISGLHIVGTPTSFGSSTFELTATGPGGISDPMQVSVSVTARAPRLFTKKYNSKVGNSFNTAGVSLLDPAPDRIATSWSVDVLPDGITLNTATGDLTGTFQEMGPIVSRLTATGPGGTSAPVDIFWEITEGFPSVTPNQTFNAKVGVPFSANILLTNAENRPATNWVSFGLPLGLNLNSTTGEVTGTPLSLGNFSATIQVRGPGGSQGQTAVGFVVAAGVPIITDGQIATAKTGEPFSHSFVLTDIANRPVTSWGATGLPTGFSINTSTGALTGTTQDSGNRTITLTATGPGGTDTKAFTLSISAGVPVIKTGQTLSGSVGVAFLKYIELEDALDRPATLWSASGLPTGLTLDTAAGAISGTPTAQGSFSVSVTATGPGGTSVPTLITLTIAKIAGVISISGLSHVYDGTIKGVTVSGGTSISVVYSGSSTVPVAVGSYAVRAFFSEGSNFTGPEAIGTMVISAGVPILKSGQVFSAQKNLQSSHFVVALDVANRPVTAWSATGLPAGLSINSTTGVLSGMVSEEGIYPITLTATGPGGTDTKSASVRVSVSAPQVANQTHTIKIGEIFEAFPDVSNAETAPIDSFSAVQPLPAGLQLDGATGRIFGTPTEYKSSPTISSIRARNAAGDILYHLTFEFVYGTPRPKNKNFVAAIDASVSFSLEGTDTANYKIDSWQLSSTLPAGLTLNPTTGAITGSPTSVVSQTLTATATGPGGTATSQVAFDIGLPVAEILPLSFQAELESPVTISIELASGSFSAPTEWTATGLPQGLRLFNGVISGAALEAGEFQPQIATKNKYGESTKVVNIAVPKGAPRISQGQSFQLKTDRKISQKIETDMPGSRPVSQWAAALPSGLRISSDGVVSGFAQSPGTFNVVFTAISEFGTDSKSIPFVITGNRFYGVKNPVLQPGRTVRTFSSGLVAVTEPYKMRPAFESTARAMFAEGNLLNAESTSNTPLIIYPAPDFRSGDAGFVECTVTAYGITNSQPVTNTSKRLQSVVVLDKVTTQGGGITFTERTEQHLVNYHVLKTAVPKGSSVAMPTGVHGITPKPGYTLNADLIFERYDVTNYGGYDEVVVASGYKVKFTQI